MPIEPINPDTVHPTPGRSEAIKCRRETMVFVAGQVALDANGLVVGEGDALAQARQAFANVGTILEQAGAGYGDVVKLTAFLTDRAFAPAFRQAREEAMGPVHAPAATIVEVSGLLGGRFLMEVDAIAMVPERRSAKAWSFLGRLR
jgi:enamine deaminase RidA (YjgF/YER057c/UK114 family)